MQSSSKESIVVSVKEIFEKSLLISLFLYPIYCFFPKIFVDEQLVSLFLYPIDWIFSKISSTAIDLDERLNFSSRLISKKTDIWNFFGIDEQSTSDLFTVSVERIFKKNRLVEYKNKACDNHDLNQYCIYRLYICNTPEHTMRNWHSRCIECMSNILTEIPNRGAYFGEIELFVKNLNIKIMIKLFTKNGLCFYIDPICEGQPIHLISLINNNRNFICDSMNKGNSMNIIALILKEIYQYELPIIGMALQKMNVPLEIREIIKMFYCISINRIINIRQL